ncbi:hypothetical protein DKX38_003616 [Salix brachista]|uniref:Uncharacterized protein n=1 Tax=Salix brachista TaxID=2182728 RepID=A0A5N5NSG6_9ROSI|nr:hypothetical protein DKX38_003616 [Salix brachista]
MDQKRESILNEYSCPAIFRKVNPLNASMTMAGDQSSTCSLKPKGQANGLQQLLELGDPKKEGQPLLALALLLAMILRAMISTRRNEFEEDDFENVRGRTREPLLNHAGQTFSPGTHTDIWTSRMREKYGLSTGDKPNLNQNASISMKSKSLEARVHGRSVLIGENILRKVKAFHLVLLFYVLTSQCPHVCFVNCCTRTICRGNTLCVYSMCQKHPCYPF